MNKKIINIKSLSKKLGKIKKNKKIILCHGVFDVLHIGHINHFNTAKKLGDILVVSVTPDQFVNKGPNRPIFPINLRMQSIAALKCVDYVVANTTNTAVYPILNIKPSIYCKGKDYKNNNKDYTGNIRKELNAIKKVKGKIFYTKDELFSSSKIINSFGMSLTDEQKFFIQVLKKENSKNNTNIVDKINSFSNLKVLVIGETIIDEYIYCDALGKSGKEPVLAVKNLNSKKFIGGAMSIANNLSSFCQKVTILSYIGEKKEQLGFIKKNVNKNVKPILIPKKNSCTIVKKRYVDEVSKTKILGVYSIEDHLINKMEEKKFTKKILEEVKKNDLVVVSDYGHGLISDRLAKLITTKSKFLAINAQLNAANIRHHTISRYKKPDLVIINEAEMRHEMRDRSEKSEVLLKQISKKIKSKFTIVTSGRDGSALFVKKENKIYKCPAFANKVIDKIGAGDAMLSLLSLAIYKNFDYKLGMFISSLAAAINVQTEANSLILKKNSIIKSAESYLK